MRHPNPDMLLRIAQADAYGAAVEYIKLPEHEDLRRRALKFERYLQHPTHGLSPGRYTDDTQMSIAVAEVLAQGDFTPERFAAAFVRAFKRDPRKAYARGFQAFLESVTDPSDFMARIKPDSDKNGAAMRSVPLGVLRSTDQVMHVAEMQARVTHNTEGGVLSSQMVALMSHFALREDKPLSELPEWLGSVMGLGSDFLNNCWWEGGPVKGPGVGMATARAVLRLVAEQPTLLDILRTTIEWGGDTDSVAAIAWGIASARMREPLPLFFEFGLEHSRALYGVEFLRNLGRDLMDAY